MVIPPIARYANILSVPLFAFIALMLLHTTHTPLYLRLPLSKRYTYMNTAWQRFLFNANFALKATLDMLFVLYYLNRLNVAYSSFTGIISITAILCFFIVAFFPEPTHRMSHLFLIYAHLLLWVIGQILLVRFFQNSYYPLFLTLLLVPITIICVVAFARKYTTIAQQATVLTLCYIWVLGVVFYFMP